MYVIVEAGGRQWKVEPGTQLKVNRVPAEVGATHALDRVLFAHDGKQAQIGRPYLKDAKVVCEVVEHLRGEKTISYYFRRRENWRKTIGHRQQLSRLLVKDIRVGGTVIKADETTAKPKARKPKAAAPKRTAAKASKTAKAGKTTKTTKAAKAGKPAKPRTRAKSSR